MSTILINILIKLAVVVSLLTLATFFTSSETALTILRKSQILKLIKIEGLKKLKMWQKEPNRLLTTILIGTAVSVVGVSVMSTSIALDLSREFNFSTVLATTVSTFAAIFLVLLFVEILPKAYARMNSLKVVRRIIGPLIIITTVLKPVVNIFLFISNQIIKIFGGKSIKDNPLFAVEELKGLIDVGEKEGVLGKNERRMLSQIIEFGDTVAREIMVPKVDMKALDIEGEANSLIQKAIDLGHSRIPVYRDHIDNIIGILYVRDLLSELIDNQDISVEELLREPYYIPEEKSVDDLLKQFKTGSEHLAIVVDEYGVPTGLITIEDIVEEITGEIFDEYDIYKKTIKRVGKNTWLVDAVEDLDKINDKIGLNLPEDTYDSLGGFITGELERVPEEGEEIDYNGVKIRVTGASPTRVTKVKIFLPTT
ncbi:MAG: hemolysin family protein [Elusimicrobiota bacterium]